MRLAALFAGLLLVPGGAGAADDEARHVEAALVQVRLLLDLGEVARADALTRRGLWFHEDDLRWHRARLDALWAAGMDPWIQAEYGDVRDASLATVVAGWEVDVGRRLGLPPGLDGRGADVERARVALGHGDPGPARAVAFAGETAAHWSLRASLLALEGDDATRAELLGAWPRHISPVLAAPLLRTGGRPHRSAVAFLSRVDAGAADGDILDALWAAELALALDDAERLATAAARIEVLGGRRTAQAELDGYARGPGYWTTWMVPLKPRRTPDALEAEGRELAREARPVVPRGRADERRRLAVALAEALQAQDRVLDADRVLFETLGPCTPTVQPEVLLATGRVREGRDLAERALFACLGATDLFPTDDPAGLDVDVRLDQVAEAWLRFGRAADLGEWFEDAALAYGIAARLQPSPEGVAVARGRARAVGLEVDGTGLPPVEVLIERMADEPWLFPADALQATRARLGLARTVGWLDPTPAHLADAVLPKDLCVPTLRSRCQLERAVAALALRRARQPVPDDLDVVDPGAELAAEGVLDRLQQARFLRQAALVRAIDDRPRDLDTLLEGSRGVRVGYRAPRWRTAGVRAADLDHRVVVLWFWASWSKPSWSALPLLDALAQRWEQERLPVRVLAVSADDSEAAWRRTLGRLDWQAMTVLRDPDLRDTFAARQLPTVYTIDPTGILRDTHIGYEGDDLGWLDATVRTWLRLASGTDDRRAPQPDPSTR